MPFLKGHTINTENLSGMTLGCWYVVGRSGHKVVGGTRRITWEVECTNCDHKFDVVGRNFSRRTKDPKYCKNCK